MSTLTVGIQPGSHTSSRNLAAGDIRPRQAMGSDDIWEHCGGSRWAPGASS